MPHIIKELRWFNAEEQKSWSVLSTDDGIFGGYDAEKYPECNYALYSMYELFELGWELIPA